MQPNYLFVLTWDFIMKNVHEWEAFPVNYYMGHTFPYAQEIWMVSHYVVGLFSQIDNLVKFF